MMLVGGKHKAAHGEWQRLYEVQQQTKTLSNRSQNGEHWPKKRHRITFIGLGLAQRQMGRINVCWNSSSYVLYSTNCVLNMKQTRGLDDVYSEQSKELVQRS